MADIICNEKWYKEPPKHVIVGRQFCLTSPISNYMPPQPQNDFNYEACDLPLPDIPYLRFDLNPCPQIAFMPKKVFYVGPLLSRLAHYKVVCTPRGRWVLKPCIMESWKWLELTLTHAIGALSSGCLFPMCVGFFDYPQDWGYLRDHAKVGHATMCVKASRTAFAALLGLFSMFYSMRAECHHRYKLSASGDCGAKESPYDILKSKTSLDDGTIQSLEDMHALLGPRIGVVINPDTNGWVQQYQYALVWAKVDHWYYWRYPLPAVTSLWRPDFDFIKSIYNKLLGSSKQWIISSPPHNVAKALAPDPPDARQCEYVPMSNSSAGAAGDAPFNTFFSDREAKIKQMMGKASPEQLSRWESRRKSAKHILDSMVTPNTKSKVFHWAETNGVRVRTPIVRGEWDLIWDYDQKDRPRSCGQKIYCEYTDEWDVCTEFDEDCKVGPVSRGDLTAIDEAFEDDGGDDPRPFGPMIPASPLPVAPPPSHAPPSPLPTDTEATPHVQPLAPDDGGDPPYPSTRITNRVPPPPPPLPTNYNELGAELTAKHVTSEVDRFDPPLDEILFVRFGLIVGDVASDLRLGAIRLDNNTLTLEEVAAVLMEKYGSADNSTKDAVRYIVTTLQREKSISPEYWDLHADSPESLRLHSPHYFEFIDILSHLHGNSRHLLEGYEVRPRNPRYERNWTVVMDSPIAVTQCIREKWGPSLEDVVERAVKDGYRIHVLRKCHRDDLPPRSEPPVILERRKRGPGFNATQQDYTSFLSVVELLMHQPRFKSVIFRGGILARICVKFTHMRDLLEGPSLDAERYGLRWVGIGSDCWVEDYISEAEIELLIGTFYIATDRPNQFSKKSFFPSPGVWDTSGLNTRAWTNSAEEKYQSTLSTVMGSDGAPSARRRLLSTAEWRQNLRLFKNKTQNFLTLVENEAAALIKRGET